MKLLKGIGSILLSLILGMAGICLFANTRYLTGWAGAITTLLTLAAVLGSVWLAWYPIRRAR